MLTNNGDGSFAAGPGSTTGDAPRALAAGDLNGDGRPDVVVANEDGDTISVLLAAGAGAFHPHVTYATGQTPVDVVLGDLDGDGDLDVVAANWGELTPVNETVSILLNQGNGTFAPQVTHLVGGRPSALVLADMNGDGLIDLVVANEFDDTVAVLPGLGDGSFAEGQALPVANSPQSLAVGDFDGNGDVDIATATNVFDLLDVLLADCDMQPQPTGLELVWTAISDHAAQDESIDMLEIDGAGNVISAGMTVADDPNAPDYILAKHTPEGELLWTATYDGTARFYDETAALAVGPGGVIAVTGSSWGLPFNSIHWATVHFSPDGAQSWAERYPDSGGQQYVRDVAIDGGGSVIVGGYVLAPGFETALAVVKYDALGATQWERTYPADPMGGSASRVISDANGDVLVAGGVSVASSGSEIAVLRYDAAGNLLWSRQHDATDHFLNNSGANDIVLDGAGNIYVAGRTFTASVSEGGSGLDMVLLKYDASGTLLWDRVKVHDGDEASAIMALGPEGNIYLSTRRGSGHMIVAYDASGTELWSDIVGDTPAPGRHLAIGADGNVHVLLQTGSTLGVLRYTPDGDLIDTTTLNTPAADLAGAIASDGDGHIYVAGSADAEGPTRGDILVFKLRIPGFVPAAAGDTNGDGAVNVDDLVAVIAAWGPCPAPPACPADLNGDGTVNVDDLVMVIVSWSS